VSGRSSSAQRTTVESPRRTSQNFAASARSKSPAAELQQTRYSAVQEAVIHASRSEIDRGIDCDAGQSHRSPHTRLVPTRGQQVQKTHCYQYIYNNWGVVEGHNSSQEPISKLHLGLENKLPMYQPAYRFAAKSSIFPHVAWGSRIGRLTFFALKSASRSP